MPGWHEAIKDQIEDGSIQVVGIILEQHPDRCRLFMQWKELSFPILVDSMNLMDAPLAPLSYLLDESGRVVELAGRPRSLEEFLAREPVEWTNAAAPTAPDLESLDRMPNAEYAGSMADFGTKLLLWGGEERIDGAVGAFARAVELAPDRGDLHFKLGVAYRRRYESEWRQPGDFGDAVAAWEAALETDPNQYIWRRRIQQYGPRLDKPYPFYDWVDDAREAIRWRGDEPVELRVEPQGAEIAQPARAMTSGGSLENPDPDGRILRDKEGFIRVESVVVAHTYGDERAARIHLEFRPNTSLKAHWNNEGGGLVVWVDPPAGWIISSRLTKVEEFDHAVSTTPRYVEIELAPPEGADAGRRVIPAYALYYVCEDVSGVCLYRRQDLELIVEVE